MNKYIKTDIEQGMSFLKVAINNALSDLENGREQEINFDVSLPLQLILQCAKERDWFDDHSDEWTNGWQVDYWYRMMHPNRVDYLHINGSLLDGNTTISISIYE